MMFTASLWLPPRHMRLPCWSRPGFTHPPSGAFLIGIRGHEALELHGQPSWWHCSPIWPHRSREAFFGACVLRHFPRPSLKTCPTCPMLSHYLVPSLTTLSPSFAAATPSSLPLSGCRSSGRASAVTPAAFSVCLCCTSGRTPACGSGAINSHWPASWPHTSALETARGGVRRGAGSSQCGFQDTERADKLLLGVMTHAVRHRTS